jgi:calcineurin-like phosphoesterase family protein
MINNFKKIFGKPEDIVICIGDFEQKKHMKYKEQL